MLPYVHTDPPTLIVAVQVISYWSLAYMFAPLTLSSLIPLERLFTAKLMFANTQSRHTHNPFCVCVFVRAGLCICNWL